MKKKKAILMNRDTPSSFSVTTMLVYVLIAVHMALLAVAWGVELKDKPVSLKKCCDVHKMLSSDGKSCVEANWPSNFSIKRDKHGRILPPLDREWVRRWLPPGLSTGNISYVTTAVKTGADTVVSVNASSLWAPSLLEGETLSRSAVAFLGEHDVARPRPGGGFRRALYCVDAAPPPLGPFAMRVRSECGARSCANKCCGRREQLMRNKRGKWQCRVSGGRVWAASKSSLADFDSEFPYGYIGACEHLRRLPFEERYSEWARHTAGIHHFLFSTWTTCFDFYRGGNGSVHEAVFACEHSRITRGIYWLLRPLCFFSALLLAASLVSVACDKSMRRNIHGRCLASHAACLLAFNIGQIVYSIAISDDLDEHGKDFIPPVLQTMCKCFALSMYFLLTSAWIWLTALCVNMAMGFRLHKKSVNKGSGKRFLAISAFAWGLPAVLTTTCSVLFTPRDREKTPAWYAPSLVETRVCYIEPLSGQLGILEEDPYMKYGTALHYYGPVCCMVMCNIICLAVTLRKVQYLKRGNTVLRREEDQIPLGQRHAEGNNPPTAHTATGNGQTRGGGNRRATTVDAKTIKLYIKMVLISGGIELLSEIIMWYTTHGNLIVVIGARNSYSHVDKDLAYRAAGYVTDFFRAAVVTWLAAPEGGYLGLIMRILRRDKRKKKSAGAGHAGRRKQNVA